VNGDYIFLRCILELMKRKDYGTVGLILVLGQ
jgi:hypothetical protein